jgi:DNA-binding GntR family transcriptional regulator
MLDPGGDTHIYMQISALIRARIAGLPDGTPAPSEADLQREFGVARTTSRRAMRVLREEGLVHCVQGHGAFVGPPGTAARRPRKVHLYQTIADDIAGCIRRGEIAPRRAIPGEVRLTQEYDCARETVRRAMALLREQGWIYTVPQRGSFVSPAEKWPPAPVEPAAAGIRTPG